MYIVYKQMTFTFYEGGEEGDGRRLAPACWNVQSDLVEFVAQVLASILRLCPGHTNERNIII